MLKLLDGLHPSYFIFYTHNKFLYLTVIYFVSCKYDLLILFSTNNLPNTSEDNYIKFPYFDNL